MSYTLQAVIGTEGGLKSAAMDGAIVVSLPQGMALLPVGRIIRERFDIPLLEFGNAEEALHRVANFIAEFGEKKLAYVEAEFFGGNGGQAAAVWEGSRLIFGPMRDTHAINQALAVLGVVKGAARDEFEALALGRYRDTESWKPN